MKSTIYTIYLYNFDKKTFTDQKLYFNNEKDVLNYCFMHNINFILLGIKDLYVHIECGKDLKEEDLNKMLKDYAVFYKDIAFQIVKRCNDIQDSLKEKEVV